MARTTDSDLAPQELRVLVAVADTGGFSAAAGALGLTQSAVSHSVRGSERKIGAVLFDRGRAGARTTPAGERAVTHARRVLRLLDVLAAEARGAARPDAAEGVVRIAAFRSAALHLLPPVLRRLRDRHPGIEPRVRVVREVGRGTAGEVADGKADLAIATLGGSAPLPPGLVAHGLLDEPYALVHTPGHPAPRSLPLVDWAENCGSYTRDWWAAQDWIPKATIEAEDDGAVLALVSGGHGMAIMPALSLTGAPDSVAVTDLGPGRPTRRVGYVTTSELAGSAVVRALVRELRAALPADRGAP
ncbi:LysR family transcriptional regulator [Streptomyces antibioticus]|uniref:LysR family transcriptional regulator n=1 Tax=Streptomyces antibioticus TaxID=1890 RepID=A0AAE6YG64_STRAT|nr:LysR family transcriptional regulator [Streptomyces antibioticus]MCX5173219.1 LysR family transcriptional regulator [Streptomyces antibioticus]OOQ47905.1 LysR family transcriptional regulator [Streptomyces antibioticus]QIT48239.1 LysR family transcriptional regulator [Streptomyces antibioticus]